MSPFKITLSQADRIKIASKLATWFTGLPKFETMTPEQRASELATVSDYAATLELRVDERGVTVLPAAKFQKFHDDLSRGTLNSPRLPNVNAFVVSATT